MVHYVEMQDAAAIVRQHDEDVQHAKGRCRDREEIDGGEGAGVIGQEGAPRLGGRLARWAWHQARDLALGDPDAELEQFAMDTWSAPQGVGSRHPADEVAGGAIDGRASRCSARTPGPKAAKGQAVPAHHRGWPHDDQNVPPAGPRAREGDPEEPVGPA